MANNMEVEQNVFQLPIDIVASGVVEKTLQTENTFVDKDIKVSVNVPEGTIVGCGTASAVGGNGVELTRVAAEPESGFYIKATATGNASVDTNGWVDKDKTAAVSVNADEYYTIDSVSLSNTKTEGKEYAEVNAPVLISGSGLYINEGYIENTYIPLADLVPDEANVIADENSHLIYKTVSVYDKDGNLVAGTMDDARISDIYMEGIGANIDIVSVDANADETAFNITGSANISGSARYDVLDIGYIRDIQYCDKQMEGEATLSASIPKIGLDVSVDKESVKFTPAIEKDGSTTVNAGDITTEQPTGHYVAVSTSALEDAVTISPVVSTEGYGTADVNSATSATVNVSAASSGMYYVPITEGSHTIVENESQIVKAATTVSTNVAGTVDVSAGILSDVPEGDYITIGTTTTKTSGSVQTTSTCTVAEGYVTADEKMTTITEVVDVESTEAAPKYIRIYDGSIL